MNDKYIINGKTKLVGLLGYPISHSRSPRMHNAAFQYLNLNFVYMAFDIIGEDLEQAIEAMKVLKVAGFNVTMPNKSDVMQLLDDISPEARLIGSVNTVLNDNGRLIGYNTDGKGYVMALSDEGISPKGKRIVMAGAGGAARSIAIQLALEGAEEIVILNRAIEAAEVICNTINSNISSCRAHSSGYSEDGLRQLLRKADLFINCTPLGMHPDEDESIIEDPTLLHPHLVVSDIVYSPSKTKLMKIADAAGCKTFNGLGMMIQQGALAFKLWTGVDMPIEYIKEIILSK